MTAPLPLPPEIAEMAAAGALLAINHSGGKDSQAMTILLRRIVPEGQLLVVHAPLGRLEWAGTLAHIRRTTEGLPLVLARAATPPLDAVRRRRMWPSPALRWCTSDWKRSPIERELRRYLKANPRFGGRVVSCMGMRADESARRAKQPALKRSTRNERAGRRWLDWLPIHAMSEADVFETIRAAGERPHWVYRAGMSRCSCSFCIMATDADLRHAARLRPDLAAEYVALEAEIGHAFRTDGTRLADILAYRETGRAPSSTFDIAADPR